MGTEWIPGISQFLAKYLLLQTSFWPMCLIFLIGAIFFLLKVAYPRMVSRTRVGAFLNIVAVLLIMWATLNLGYFLSDNGWGTDEVKSARQEEIHRLQNKTNGH